MKKACLFLSMLINICCMFIFAGCSANSSIKSISFSDTGEAVVIELGKFNYDDYKININYSNGKSEEMTLTEDMISLNDKLKFYQVGDQTITITYKNFNCEMKFKVQRAKLNNIEFEDKTVVYNGNPYTMEVQGNIPADVKVRYPNGNTFTNAGTYEITAICYGDNYETKELSATLTIEKAEFDMSNIKFEDATFVYDKNPKSISITGNLPEGVTVEYKIGDKKTNSETNAGRYEVIASFVSKNANYKQISEKKAILMINKANFANFDLSFNDKNVTYTGHENSIQADLKNIPNGVSTYYTIQKIKNAKGERVDGLIESGNSAVMAGTYIVRLNFNVSDTENYEDIEPRTATLVIDRAVYSIDKAFMYSKSVTFDKTAKSILLSGESDGLQPVLPFGVEATYSIKMIKDASGKEIDGEVLDGNSATNAGTYEVYAHLTSSDENYKEINDIIGILEIGQAEYKGLNLTMNNLTVDYDGEEHSISVSFSDTPEVVAIMNTVTITYTIRKTKTASGETIENSSAVAGNSATETGTYEIVVYFENSDKNYSEISSIMAELVISEVKK